jgi:diaminopropionate ammonia-lyase
MVEIIKNTVRGIGLADPKPGDAFDTDAVSRLLDQCPIHATTPLAECTGIAKEIGAGRVFLKDERSRMGLGSFKALGAAFAIACDAEAAGGDWATSLSGRSYVTASAGNHGLSVAAGARLFGARAVIFLANTVPEPFAERLRGMGAEVVRAGDTYEASMDAAARAAQQGGQTLLSDSSWPGYTQMPMRVMEGYLQMATEMVDQMPTAPDHILLQAGVGGLAAAVAAHARLAWGDAPRITVVEPEAAPALIESIRKGALTTTQGPVSNMGRLDCKTPSMVALAGLSRDATDFVTVSETQADQAVAQLAALSLNSTPSGAAGIAALLTADLNIQPSDTVLVILSEGPEDG